MPAVYDPVEMVPGNLIANGGYPLVYDTIQITQSIPLGSIIALDPATGFGSLANAANQGNVYAILRDHVIATRYLRSGVC